MEINELVQDRDEIIEKTLDLDAGSLIRECNAYYLGTMHNGSERVAIHVRKVVGGKILLQEMRTAAETNEQLKLVEQLDKWIDVLFEINHLPQDTIKKLHYEKWVLSLGDLKLEIPFYATSYQAFLAALESIREEL